MPKIEEMTQEDVDRMQEALDNFKKENQKFREQRDEYKAALDNNEVNAEFRERALRAEAKLKLGANGVKDPDRIIKYLKFDNVVFDEQGNLAGLDESIETVRQDFPELFDPKRRVGGKADAAANTAVKVEKSASQLQAERVLGR